MRFPLLNPRATIALSLFPALGLIALLFGSSVVLAVGQSVGYLPFIGQTRLSLDAYRSLVFGTTYAREFWTALSFSLWVSSAATVIAAVGALLLAALLGQRLRRGGALFALNVNLGFPHLVWAIGLGLLLAQSGIVARVMAALGVIDAPSAFPVLVRDRYGWGIILDYVSKETPFLLLLLLSVLRAQPTAYDVVAANLGATRWQQLRYVTLPLVLPTLTTGAMLVFAFVFGAYEVPAVLGVRYPRMLSVLALEFFVDPDLRSRAAGMALGVIMAGVVIVVGLFARRVNRTENTEQRTKD